jgi:hypothetical protein
MGDERDTRKRRAARYTLLGVKCVRECVHGCLTPSSAHPYIPTSTHIPSVAGTIMMMIIMITIPRGLPRCGDEEEEEEEEERRPGVLGSRGGKGGREVQVE